MDLGKPRHKETLSVPEKEPTNIIEYPSTSIEKKLGDFNYGDTFKATVNFRVKKVSQGKDWSGDQPTHRLELELISLDNIVVPEKKKSKAGKGLPA